VNAAHVAAHPGSFLQAAQELRHLWSELQPQNVFASDAPSIVWTAARAGMRLISGGFMPAPQLRGLLDTKPLRSHLEESLAAIDGVLTGIEANLAREKLKAVAIVATSYTTGQSIVWVQGKNIEPWTRPQRVTMQTQITVDHVMASAALPIFFPAVRIGNAWYGDGGVRLAAPLSPALHLGANRIIAVSTRYARTLKEAETGAIREYPPPAQILGIVMNAVFLDLIDQDAQRMQRINRLIEEVPPEKRNGMRPVKLLVIRPSRDLGRLAAAYEPRLPVAFKFMTRGLGTKQTRSPDILSMLMFQKDYLTRLIEIGEADAESRADEIEEFLASE
ncbi:MAG TPA: patatin-like phospholipase family protein, partial [Longimicrobiales bacterium]|nr:patatin-like phospholipase family protein [Longimicrobiales bacterium]